jgi:hypothetical protein
MGGTVLQVANFSRLPAQLAHVGERGDAAWSAFRVFCVAYRGLNGSD